MPPKAPKKEHEVKTRKEPMKAITILPLSAPTSIVMADKTMPIIIAPGR